MRFFRYGPGLRKRGVLPQVLTLRTDESLPVREEVNGIEIERFDPQALSSMDIYGQRCWLMRQALEQSIAAPAHSNLIQPNAVSYKMAPLIWHAQKHHIRAVCNLTIAPETHVRAGIIAAFKRWVVMKATYGRVSRVVVLSQIMRETYLQHCHLRPEQITVIPNGVDIQRFAPPASMSERLRLRQNLNIPAEAPVVLFVGGVMRRKGVDLLLRAWNSVTARLPQARLLILGSHGVRPSHRSAHLAEDLSAYLATMDDLCAALTHPDSVYFHGEVADPAPWYRMADVFAFPSHREGMPNVVLEAMATELPVLVTPFEGLPPPGQEMGNPGEHFLLLERDPHLWARTMIELLETSGAERRATMGQRARQWIISTNDLEKSLDQWAELYHSLARC